MTLPTLDFETYSDAGFVWDAQAGGAAAGKWAALPGAPQGKKGLSVVGAAVYAAHPSTEVLCAAYDLQDGRGTQVWTPGMPPPAYLLQHVQAGGLLEAWNSGFEHWIWTRVCVHRYGWPPLPQKQLRCAMAKARAHALPGALASAGKVVGAIQQKDPDGTRLLRKYSIPRNPTAKDARTRVLPDPYDTDSRALYNYCRQDVEAEIDVSARCPEIEGEELQYWLCDQAINYRGVAIDLEGVENCIAIIDEAHALGNARLYELTGGAVARVSEVARLLAWLHLQGAHMESLDEEHVTEALTRPMTDNIREALTIRAAIGSAAVKKTYAMRNQCAPDGRLHDLFSYHAARTGRATGNGPQPTNLPNHGPDVVRCKCGRHHGKTLPLCPWCGAGPYDYGKVVEWNADATADALEVIGTRSLDALMYFFGEGLPVVSACLRGLFVAAPGHDLICSDYSSIEAVVLAEIAGEAWRREVFQTHGRIYEVSAASITGIPFDEAVRHPKRKLGKVSELASGFQGWINSWKAFGADEFLSDEEIKHAILAWRAASPAIVELWGGQERNWKPERFGCEGMAINAIQYPGTPQHVMRLDGSYSGVTFQAQDDVLYCRLPSGRCLTYHRPRLRESDRRPGTLAMSYEGWNTNPKNGPVGWIRMDTWGGRLVENCIAEGTEVLTRRGWVFIESVRPDDLVHDGIDFVPHGGLLFKSVQPCIQVDGVWMTDDHEVLTNDGSWCAAKTKPRPFRPEVWNADGDGADGRKEPKAAVAVFVRVREFLRTGRNRSNQVRQEWANAKLRLRGNSLAFPKNEDARYEPPPSLRRMEVNERSVPLTVARRLEELRRPGDKGLRRMASVFRGLLAGYGANLLAGLGVGPDRQQRALLQGELPVDVASTKHNEPTRFYPHGRRTEAIGSDRDFTINFVLPAGERVAGRRPDEAPRLDKQVFDILNCGPRHRFVVRGEIGPFIVHNCVQATSRDILRRATINLEAAGYPVVLHVYDEIVAEVPEGLGSVEQFEQIMGTMPEFAAGWPVRAKGGWRGRRYRK